VHSLGNTTEDCAANAPLGNGCHALVLQSMLSSTKAWHPLDALVAQSSTKRALTLQLPAARHRFWWDEPGVGFLAPYRSLSLPKRRTLGVP